LLFLLFHLSTLLSLSLISPFLFYCYPSFLILYSFPTRRSSDLNLIGQDSLLLRNAFLRQTHIHHLILLSINLNPSGYKFIERRIDRKSTRLNSTHVSISYAVFCLKKKKIIQCNL